MTSLKCRYVGQSQAKPSQAKPSQAKPSQAKPSQAKRTTLFLMFASVSTKLQLDLHLTIYRPDDTSPFTLTTFVAVKQPVTFNDTDRMSRSLCRYRRCKHIRQCATSPRHVSVPIIVWQQMRQPSILKNKYPLVQCSLCLKRKTRLPCRLSSAVGRQPALPSVDHLLSLLPLWGHAAFPRLLHRTVRVVLGIMGVI